MDDVWVAVVSATAFSVVSTTGVSVASDVTAMVSCSIVVGSSSALPPAPPIMPIKTTAIISQNHHFLLYFLR